MTDEPKQPEYDDELTESLSDGMTDAAATETTSGREAIRTARQIGPYRLIEQIGEGGMGEVWLAEQTEGVWRRVALKVIRPGMDTRSFIARFEAERQAMAMMDHPTIAKIFDAGETADGRPYLVMEYIQGCDLQQLIRIKGQLEVADACEMIRQAALGLDYAYQHAFGHVWNDFDSTSYCDHNFTYPTVDGVIDTIQWEGFREAVDDVRYMTTLEDAIRTAAPERKDIAAAAQAWIDQLAPAKADLAATRAEMAQWIIRLKGLQPKRR